MSRWNVVGILLTVALGVSCTSVQYQADRLDEAVGSATQRQVLEYFGPPDEARELPDGGTEWTYRYRRTSIRGTEIVGRTICWKNVLRFDQEGVLRERRRQAC